MSDSQPTTAAIAVLGLSLPARGWAIAFARAGYEVRLHHGDRRMFDSAVAEIAIALGDLGANDLLNGLPKDAVAGRIRLEPDLAAAVADAVYVQDNTEGLAAKRAVFERLDALAPPQAILASSNVAQLPSSFAEELKSRSRVLLAHPINPALMPVVEVAPTPWTDAAVVTRTCELLTGIGLRPLRLKEARGMVIDRLAAALIREAFHLVAQGLATVHDVDTCVADGLARRWVIAGPFETMDINFPGGIAEYIRVAEPSMGKPPDDEKSTVAWAGDLSAVVEAQRRSVLPADEVGDRLKWRDLQLARLAAHKRTQP